MKLYVASYASCEDANCMNEDHDTDAEQMAWPNAVGIYADFDKAKASAVEMFVEENSDMFDEDDEEVERDTAKWSTSGWQKDDSTHFGGNVSHTCVVSYNGDVVGVVVVREMEVVQ